MRTTFKLILLIVAFTAASVATYITIQRWKAVTPAKLVTHRQDTLEGVNGLSEGEVVTLPKLSTLNGEQVDLGNLKEERLLCVFIGSRCSGCTMDAELWKALAAEAPKKATAFYLIDIGDERPDLEHFSASYRLDKLPLLFDPDQKVGPQLKVGFLPQYVLFTRKGEVVHRWDGIRQHDQRDESAKLAEFFQPHN
jgi:peroxiredoxin